MRYTAFTIMENIWLIYSIIHQPVYFWDPDPNKKYRASKAERLHISCLSTKNKVGG